MNYAIETNDAIEYLVGLAPESVDLVVTDYAYESLEKHRAKGTTTRLKASDASSNEWFPIFPNARVPELMTALFRVLKKGTHLYMICDQETHYLIRDTGKAAGFTWHKFLVWDKVRPGMGYHYRATHEVICFLEKGKRSGDGRGSLNDNTTADVLRFEDPDIVANVGGVLFDAWAKVGGRSSDDLTPLECLQWAAVAMAALLYTKDYGAILSHDRVNPKGAYPTEKPVPLLQELIRMSSRAGDLVVDPFGGSFSTGVAASLLGRRFGGCDVKQSAVDAGIRRLSETPFLGLA